MLESNDVKPAQVRRDARARVFALAVIACAMECLLVVQLFSHPSVQKFPPTVALTVVLAAMPFVHLLRRGVEWGRWLSAELGGACAGVVLAACWLALRAPGKVDVSFAACALSSVLPLSYAGLLAAVRLSRSRA